MRKRNLKYTQSNHQVSSTKPANHEDETLRMIFFFKK